MTRSRLFALFFIASCAGSAWSAGPNVYKCGSTYSQTPCDGAVAMQVDDARTKEQKSQSDAAIKQQGKAANAMEKARLKEEAQAIAQSRPAKSATKPPAKPHSKSTAEKDAAGTAKNGKSKVKESEFFTAKEALPAKKN